jgi:hypothetical protein
MNDNEIVYRDEHGVIHTVTGNLLYGYDRNGTPVFVGDTVKEDFGEGKLITLKDIGLTWVRFTKKHDDWTSETHFKPVSDMEKV